MRLHVADHPLVAHKLTVLRNQDTVSPTFRLLVDELVTLLAYEATREVRVRPFPIVTPVAPTIGTKLADPRPIVVPILRAGLGMLDGMTRLLPTAEVGFLGMRRDEETLEAITEERDADEPIWGSMIKQAIKRRNPGFNERAYGFASFNDLLLEAQKRGLLKLNPDKKSGGYTVQATD